MMKKHFFKKRYSSFHGLCNLLFLGLTPHTVFCNPLSLELTYSAKRSKKGRGEKIHPWHFIWRTDTDGFPLMWQPYLTFSSKAAILSFRWSWRRSLDSVRSLSTVSERRLLCSSFIFSLCRAWRNKLHNWSGISKSYTNFKECGSWKPLQNVCRKSSSCAKYYRRDFFCSGWLIFKGLETPVLSNLPLKKAEETLKNWA